jgi:hypothetical protein
MLTIYAPFSNKKSKAWEVFNGVEKSWPDQITKLDNAVETDPLSNSMFWGFVGNNREMVKKLEARNHNNLKPDNHYWRICKNTIHVPYIKDCKSDRFEKFGINIKAPNFAGKYILVCPSSPGVNSYLDRPNWTTETIEQIKRYTDRPIRLRHKPRGRGTSGPSEARVPLSEDLKEAWCLVTSCSIAAVEAMCEGIPVFCDNKSFAVDVGNIELADIENPYYGGPEPWLYSLAYQQFTPEEFANGTAVEILLDKGIL